MPTPYLPEIGTYFFPINGDPENLGSWRSAIRSALAVIASDITIEEICPEISTAPPVQAEVPSVSYEDQMKVMAARGIPMDTPEAKTRFQEMMDRNQVQAPKAVYLTAMVEVAEGKRATKRIMTWIGFQDWPGKPTEYLQGFTRTPQVLKIGKSKDEKKEGENPYIPLMPINKDGVYYFYFPQIGAPSCHAKKGFGKDIQCQALYTRFPQDGESHGTPMYKPEWLEHQSCNKCKYAPHRNKKNDKVLGIVYNDTCKACHENYGLFGCVYNEMHGLIWGNLSISGSLSYILQNDTGMKLRPRYANIIGIKDLAMTNTAGRKKRILLDCTPPDQEPVVSRDDATMFTFVNVISGRVRDYYKKRLTPKNTPAPESFDPEKYEKDNTEEVDDLPPIDHKLEQKDLGDI